MHLKEEYFNAYMGRDPTMQDLTMQYGEIFGFGCYSCARIGNCEKWCPKHLSLLEALENGWFDPEKDIDPKGRIYYEMYIEYIKQMQMKQAKYEHRQSEVVFGSKSRTNVDQRIRINTRNQRTHRRFLKTKNTF